MPGDYWITPVLESSSAGLYDVCFRCFGTERVQSPTVDMPTERPFLQHLAEMPKPQTIDRFIPSTITYGTNVGFIFRFIRSISRPLRVYDRVIVCTYVYNRLKSHRGMFFPDKWGCKGVCLKIALEEDLPGGGRRVRKTDDDGAVR